MIQMHVIEQSMSIACGIAEMGINGMYEFILRGLRHFSDNGLNYKQLGWANLLVNRPIILQIYICNSMKYTNHQLSQLLTEANR